MSIRIMTQVWAHSQQKGSALLLLLAIADFADDDGEAWPGIPTLAKKIRMSERQTVRLRQRLYESGELELVAEGGGRGNTDLVRVIVNPDKLSQDDAVKGDTLSEQRVTSCPANHDNLSERVTDCSEKGDILVRKGDIAMSPDPSIEPSCDPSIEPNDDDDAGPREGEYVLAAWEANIGPINSPILHGALQELINDCGSPAVMHGIAAAVEAGAANFRYVAACARNQAAGNRRPFRDDQRPRKGKHDDYGDDDTPEARRRRYIPDDYADIILG